MFRFFRSRRGSVRCISRRGGCRWAFGIGIGIGEFQSHFAQVEIVRVSIGSGASCDREFVQTLAQQTSLDGNDDFFNVRAVQNSTDLFVQNSGLRAVDADLGAIGTFFEQRVGVGHDVGNPNRQIHPGERRLLNAECRLEFTSLGFGTGKSGHGVVADVEWLIEQDNRPAVRLCGSNRGLGFDACNKTHQRFGPRSLKQGSRFHAIQDSLCGIIFQTRRVPTGIHAQFHRTRFQHGPAVFQIHHARSCDALGRFVRRGTPLVGEFLIVQFRDKKTGCGTVKAGGLVKGADFRSSESGCSALPLRKIGGQGLFRLRRGSDWCGRRSLDSLPLDLGLGLRYPLVAEPGLHKNAFLVLAQNLQRLARGQRGFPGNATIDQNRYRNRFHKPRAKRPADRGGRPGDFLIEALEVVFEFLFLRSRRRFDFLAFFAFGGGFLLLLGGAQLGGRDLLKSLLGEFREFRSLLSIPDGLLLLLLGDQSQTLGLRAGGLLFRQAIRKTPHRASHQDENQNQRHRSHDRGGLVPADQFSREVESGDRSRRNRLAPPEALQIRQQCGNAPVAIVGRGAKTLQDDDLQIGIDRGIELPRAHWLVRLQRLDVGEEISARCEMPPPGAHLVENRSQRIDIGARIHALARFGLLRRHVLDSADHIATH